MATSSENDIPGLPLEISWLVERVRKWSFYNIFLKTDCSDPAVKQT
jgi:hypothetical protein